MNSSSSSKEEEEEIAEFRLPSYLLTGGLETAEQTGPAPKFPVLVFVNSKSGGQLGGPLIQSFRALLNPSQVYDLSEHQPGDVLHSVLGYLQKLHAKGDQFAGEVRNNLRLIVAGGDGTAGWLLGTVGDLKLENPPPVATVPLGTGNNLPFSFGWGKRNPGTDAKSVRKILRQVAAANPVPVDSWHLTLRLALPSDASHGFEPVQLPHSLHSFVKVSPGDELHEDGRLTFRGGFWNYLSMGMDAQVSYEFHKKRERNPDKFKNQSRNQLQYAKISCTQGWFCAHCFYPASRNIKKLAKVQIAKHDGVWQDLHIHSSIRTLLLLNLPSFSGGLDPWGVPSDKKSIKRGLTGPFVNDGMLEIIGFRDGWHGLALLSPKGHGTRLAQAHMVRIEFLPDAADQAFVRMDGEPWLQPLPSEEKKSTIMEISHLGRVMMLATNNCLAKTVSEEKASEISALMENQDEPDEAKRKFGASATFNPRLFDARRTGRSNATSQ